MDAINATFFKWQLFLLLKVYLNLCYAAFAILLSFKSITFYSCFITQWFMLRNKFFCFFFKKAFEPPLFASGLGSSTHGHQMVLSRRVTPLLRRWRCCASLIVLSGGNREWIQRSVQRNPVSARLARSVVRHGDRRKPPLRSEQPVGTLAGLPPHVCRWTCSWYPPPFPTVGIARTCVDRRFEREGGKYRAA